MEEAATLDVVVVYQRQEFYVATQASADRKTLLVDLLQCQLLSLVGVMPDEQILLSSTGEVLYGPSKGDVATISVATAARPRFFLLSSAEETAKVPELASDWRQICTKSTFGDAPIVQPAFRKIAPSGGDLLATLICEPCARTCTTGFQVVNPMEWNASKELAARFISDVAAVAGDVDVPAPSGFTKLPVPLNYSASGDYVYLCVKRGGPRALTQLHVLYERMSGSMKEGLQMPAKMVAVDYKSGDAARDGMNIRVGYGSVQLKGNMEELETLAITDIVIIIGDASPPSPAYVKILRNLNEGAQGACPVFLYYQLSPLGGFACNTSRDHSEFGECLFAARHLSKVTSILDLNERCLAVAMPVLAAERGRGDAAIFEAHYRQHQPGMLKRLISGLHRAQSYESKRMQEEALRRIPVVKLHERARANPSPMPLYQDELVKQLLHWFKSEFFTWMNQPRCSSCNNEKTRSVRTEGPSTQEEVAGHASRVEVYQCPACGAFTRFPRYNDPVKLLDTRTGRCGEWANCFTLCCRAMGFEARYVLDVTDHVWTEVYSEHFKRWLHCDSCEDQLDCPLTYEVGWGKKLSYIFSFSHDEVVDTARRYTQDWADMRSRRQDVSEKWLDTTISQINRGLWEQQSPERVAILRERAECEREELRRGRNVQKAEVKGRISGSAEWKSQRNEDGTQSEAPNVTKGTSAMSTMDSVNAVPVADALQEICKNLVVGCQSPRCTNPFCLSGRTGLNFPEASANVNERAVQAIQVVSTLSSHGFSSASLAMLRCPTEVNELRSFLWKQKPLVYLPLQDSSSSLGDFLLLDISGHGNHVEFKHHGALGKPFRIPNCESRRSFGMQLLGGRRLSIHGNGVFPDDGCILSFLARLEQNATVGFKTEGVEKIIAGRLGNSDCSSSVEFRVCWDYSKRQFNFELQTKNAGHQTNVDSVSELKFGRYAHIAVVRTTSSVAMFINGKLPVKMDLVAEAMPPIEGDIAFIEGPANWASTSSAVISHVAVMPAKSLEEARAFSSVMKDNFVSAPPLRAFGPNGERSGERCSDDVAQAQSGFRVSRVLMWGGQFFDGVQFVYDHAKLLGDGNEMHSPAVFGTLFGNTNAKHQGSQPTVTFDLLPDEVITRVSGRKGAWTDCITLHTNFERTITCGGKGGGDFSVATPPKSEIRSITFKASDHLTDITAFVLEGLTTESSIGETKKALLGALAGSEPTYRRSAVSAALRYLGNIARQPEELKFQSIRSSNNFFAANVGVLGSDATKSFMEWCGFKKSFEQDEHYFVFHPCQDEGPHRLAAEAQKRIHFLKNVGSQ